MRLRPMLAEDLAQGLRLSGLAGWNQGEADWRLYLALANDRAFVAEEAGRVIGTVVAVDYGGRRGWVGMVLVDPEFRRLGAGTRLLERALASLAACETVKLDATPTGRPVYLPLGFVDEYGLMRMERDGGAGLTAPVPGSVGVEPLTEPRLAEVLAWDRAAFGADRASILRHYLAEAPEYAQVALREGRLLGYSLGRRGRRFEQIGPVIARSRETAVALVHASLTRHAGRPFLLDATLHDGEWKAWLASAGFREQRPYMRMVRGPNRHPGTPGEQFAILGPELG